MRCMRSLISQRNSGSHFLSTTTYPGWDSTIVYTAISIDFLFVWASSWGRYFSNVSVRDEHFKTKRHKKRAKQMMGPAPHTQLDADLAAGMGMPDNGPKLMSM
ncbi:hypothetical protein SAY87_007444 [Trapa incisa]|uniref:Uncharacterized protein n=1 Tax=Trapa incisa TaxID=236973 RepID=A0AAN7KMP7_9MYRT|nr:hypothetical protein SAY87_007444 [Trapa incisa]